MIESNLKNACILIVDDAQLNVNILTELLQFQGYTDVISTTDSRQVVQLFEEKKPDLILLDLMMPFVDGFQILDFLAKHIASTDFLPILVFTADVSVEAKRKALQNGANDFLTKPFDHAEVELRIHNLLHTRWMHQQIKNQNKVLEEKVSDRTSELETSMASLKIAKNAAESSDRLKTAFMNNISHEVRTPLNGILGAAQFLALEDMSCEEKKDFLPMLNKSCQRLLSTITDYMDIAMIVSGNQKVNRSAINIRQLLQKLAADYQEMCISKNLSLKLCIDDCPNDCNLLSDEALLTKAINHLLENAIKFTAQGEVLINACADNQDVLITIKDTGEGISEEAQKQIFKGFNQENVSDTRGHEGSGLGMAITKGLIDLLGGKIVLKSTKHVGTSVSIRLPEKVILQARDKKQQKALKPKSGLLHILIAEDDDQNYAYFEAVVKKLAHGLYRAKSGREAIDICKSHPELSLVLMDIKMPDMDGIEATRLIKMQRSSLPIIAITAYASSGDEYRIRQAGCDDYLAKPVRRQKLMESMARFVEIETEV